MPTMHRDREIVDRKRGGVSQGQRTHTSLENWSGGQPGFQNSWKLTTTKINGGDHYGFFFPFETHYFLLFFLSIFFYDKLLETNKELIHMLGWSPGGMGFLVQHPQEIWYIYGIDEHSLFFQLFEVPPKTYFKELKYMYHIYVKWAEMNKMCTHSS